MKTKRIPPTICPICNRHISTVLGRFAVHLNTRKHRCTGSGSWSRSEKYFRKTGKKK